MFMTYLQKLEHSKSCDLIRLNRGVQLPLAPRPTRPAWMRLNDRIVNAQHSLDVNGDVALFLRRMNHAINGLEQELNPVPVQSIEEPVADQAIKPNFSPAEVEREQVVEENLYLHQQVFCNFRYIDKTYCTTTIL
ncbi:hypothetical protein RN001_000947 [Aquatica leii]|uniref:Uncharacterized protein n=1 Tax=Aquatica leii TaxID=1421715 RepID=A0AAN7PMX5_9COLE|nr:hypothetical protein RN001_000947 [Aquatica leii]